MFEWLHQFGSVVSDLLLVLSAVVATLLLAASLKPAELLGKLRRSIAIQKDPQTVA